MANIPPVTPPLKRDFGWKQQIPLNIPFRWLAAGWADLWHRPGLSLAYGFAVFLISVLTVTGLFRFGLDYILFPALSGFMIIAPVIAVGLYEKSRRIQLGQPLTLTSMIFVIARSRGQVIFSGVLLSLLMLLWMRAAVIIYALFFGLLPFPGFDDITQVLFGTAAGWQLLTVGTFVGGLFAAFAFAISAFSIPMLLNEKSDVWTAMGTSMALVWHNLLIMLLWGLIVLTLIVIGVVTGFLAFIVVFPLLGHATWHAYQTMRQDPVAEETVDELDGAQI